jgi:hypothetical protein
MNKHSKLSHSGVSVSQTNTAVSAWFLPMRRVMSKAIRATDREDGPTLKDFQKVYNVWNAVNNIGNFWGEIKESTMLSYWKRLCQDLIWDFKGSCSSCN